MSSSAKVLSPKVKSSVVEPLCRCLRANLPGRSSSFSSLEVVSRVVIRIFDAPRSDHIYVDLRVGDNAEPTRWFNFQFMKWMNTGESPLT